MALFKSAEEKEAKQQEKVKKLLEKYGLEDLSDPRNIESVKEIASELMGTGLMETGITLGGGSEKDIAKVQMYYQKAILEQNFIIIRLLDKLVNK